MAIPLFAYSDIDTVEIELMTSEIREKEYKQGDVIAKIGQSVVPAVYIIRSGAVVSKKKARSHVYMIQNTILTCHKTTDIVEW
jgi:hypothetical protein